MSKRKKKKTSPFLIILIFILLLGSTYALYLSQPKPIEEPDHEYNIIVPEGSAVLLNGTELALADYQFPHLDSASIEGAVKPKLKLATIKGNYLLAEVSLVCEGKDVKLESLGGGYYFANTGVRAVEASTIKERAAKLAFECSGESVKDLKVSEPLSLADRWVYVSLSYHALGEDGEDAGFCLGAIFYLKDDGYWETVNCSNEPAFVLSMKDQQSYINPYSMPYGKYPYMIRVNRIENCVTVYRCDENGEYTIPVKAMVCSTGREGCETPLGLFMLEWRAAIGDRGWCYMADGSYGSCAIHFLTGGFMMHTICYTDPSPDTMFAYEYNMLGGFASLGCVRLQTVDARWIYDNAIDGTPIEIYDELGNPGPLGKPARCVEYISEEADCGWDPTDPLPQNPWRYR